MPLFRRHAQAKEDMITAQFPNPKTGHLSPFNVSISACPNEKGILQAPPVPPPHLTQSKISSNGFLSTRYPLDRNRSSEYFLEIKKSPAPKPPISRKSAWGRTIRTENPGEDAFESDAFAVQMPTTREPVMEMPREESIYRAKIPAPSKAQVEAYQTYKLKAQEVRAHNTSEGVRVPSKIISYDYAYASKNLPPVPEPLKVDISPPNSPPQLSPAGSFPKSPPIAQHAWETSAAAQVSRKQPLSSSSYATDTRSRSEPKHVVTPKKPVELSTGTSPPSSRYQRVDSVTGASKSPGGSPPTIRVRLVPRVVAKSTTPSPQSSASERSRSSSPEKSIPRFAYTKSASEQAKAEQAKATKNTVSGHDAETKKNAPDPKRTFAEILKDREKKKTEQKRTLASRWAWLRAAASTAPQVAKPTPAPTTTAPTTPRPVSVYVDPFVQHATPPPSIPAFSRPATRPSSPKKLVRPAATATAAATTVSKGKFDAGFAQITSFFTVLLKIFLVLYALIAMYFVLDAIREAIHALGAPFRGLKLAGGYLQIGLLWAGRYLAKGWDRWGFKIAFKGGWRNLAKKWW